MHGKDLEVRLYHEVILEHQKWGPMNEPGAECRCGWRKWGHEGHNRHLANAIAFWLETNFVFNEMRY